jgi:putative ABC transport system substrate-binding protein
VFRAVVVVLLVLAAESAAAGSYDDAVQRWKTADDVHAWIAANFSYDMPRTMRLSETQRARNGGAAIYEPAELFDLKRGVCVDLARFAVETLRRIDPRSDARYLMIEFDPVEVGGNTLRLHWLVTFTRDGRRYYFADSNRPGTVAGPYDETRQFIDAYARDRGRTIVAFRELESYEKRRRARATKLVAAAKVYRIGVLEETEAVSNAVNLDAFRQGLAELGYVEGQNLAIEYRSSDGRPERFRALARELVRLEVDVIVTRGTPAALAAKYVTRTIPIVMATSGDPDAEGIVRRLARPEANVIGFHILAPPQIGAERLRILKALVPGSSRVGIFWHGAGIHSPLIVRETEKTAKMMGLQLKSLEVLSRRAFDEAFEAALLAQIDALIAVEDYLTFSDRTRIVEFAAMSRMPAIYGLREFVEAGGLMSYGTDRRDLFRRAAVYVHRLLTGAKPADLPVEPPSRFELAINLKTARTLGLTIPPSLLQRADYVVD